MINNLRYKEWRYEVALAINDPDVIAEERPENLKVQAFEQGKNEDGPWRCLLCFNKRF